MLLLAPGLVITGMFVSWEKDEQIIESNYQNYLPLLAGYSHEQSVTGNNVKTITQRSYWLIPVSLESPKMLSITYTDNEVEHEATVGGFWSTLIIITLICISCYFIWVRGYDPFNKALKQGRA